MAREYGAIRGYVRDSNNNPVSGATVLTAEGEKDTTDKSGQYIIDKVLIGTCFIKAYKKGTKLRALQVQIYVEKGAIHHIDFELLEK